MQTIQLLKGHLTDNSGDENVTKMIWVAIVFIVGAILLVVVTTAFSGPIKEWFEAVVHSWFNDDGSGLNGKFSLGGTSGSGSSTPSGGSGAGFLITP